MKRSIIGAIVLGLAVSATRADTITWINASGGNWTIAGNWDVNDVPAGGDDAVIGNGGAYTVDLNASVSVDTLTISNADAVFETNTNTLTLLLPAGLMNAGTIVVNGAAVLDGNVSNANAINIDAARTLTMAGPTVTNDGTITVNFQNSNAQTTLSIDGDVILDGSGDVVLNRFTNLSQIVTTDGSTLINSAGHTIRGGGQIHAVLDNQGSVVSDRNSTALELVTNNKTNVGTMTATNSSFLDITGITVDQTGGGLRGGSGDLVANGGTVRLENGATVIGGSLSTPDGVIQNAAGTNTITDVYNAGTLHVVGATTLATSGTSLVNDGSIVVNSAQINAQTTMSFDPNVVLDGSGDIQLTRANNLSQITGGPVRQMFAHTIHGVGEIHAGMINEGTVSADVNSMALELRTADKTNTGLMTTADNGILQIGGITVSQSSGEAEGVDGQIVADAGLVQLVGGANVADGTLSTSNGGLVQNSAGANSLTDVSNQGTVHVFGGTTLNAAGTSLINNGSIVVNNASINAETTLNMDPNTLLDGTGEVVLNRSNNLARITGGPFTQASGHTIRGTGEIQAAMNNEGTVIASVDSQALELITANKTNTGLMTTGINGLLQIGGITVNQSSGGEGTDGQIIADGGFVQLVGNANVANGTLESANGGIVQNLTGTNTLTDVTNLSTLHIFGATALNVAGDGIANSGTILVNSAAINAQTSLNVAADTTIGGPGEIVLNRTGSLAQIIGGPTTHAADHTIRGTGQVVAPMDNFGSIIADRPANTLALVNGDMLNLGTLSATNTGTLSIGSVTITQTDGGEGTDGQIIADGGTVSLATGATIVGGSLNTPNASEINVNADDILLTDVTNNGLLNVAASRILSADGAALTNHGNIVVNPTQSNAQTDLNIGAGTALTGTGNVVMNHATNLARLTGGPMTHEAGHTIHGTGQILAPMDNFGDIIADRAANTLALVNGDMLNLGTLSATNTGTLSIGSVTITQVDGGEGAAGEIIADGGTVSLATGATIVGGSLNTPNASEITVNADNVLLTDVTNNGLLNVAASRILSADGAALTNDGTIVVNPTQGNSQTDLDFAAGTALDGTGEVVLNHATNRARLTGGPMTQGPDHTIRGTGQLIAALVSDGTVVADRAANELDVITNVKTNNGTFAASDGGILDVIVNVDGTGGWLADGGTVRVNSGVQVTTTGAIDVVNGGVVVVTNAVLSGSDLTMDDTGAITVASTVTLSGNVSFAMTSEALWSWAGDAELTLTGGDSGDCVVEWATVEVGGDTSTGVGFGIPNLTIADGAAVSMVDLIDNGNRSSGAESLGVTSLTLGADARLNLNGLRLFVNGAEVFPGAFGGGIIVDANGTGDLNGDGDFDVADRACFAACYGGENVPVGDECLSADFDDDGDVDCDDYTVLIGIVGGGQIPIFRPCAFSRGPVFMPAQAAAKADPTAQSSTGDCGTGVVPAAGSVGLLPFMLAGLGTMKMRRNRR